MNQYADGFFLCVPCAGGHYSYYSEFCDADTAHRIYLFKGGSDLCTHAFLAPIVREAEKRHLKIEKIYSPHAPTRLEALALPEQKIYFLDGNYPRVREAKYPVAVETLVNTDLFFDRDSLRRNASALRLIGKAAAVQQRRVMNYLSAARAVWTDSDLLLTPALDRDKIRRYAARFAAREFPAPRGEKSRAANRFLSAITPRGVFVNEKTIVNTGRVLAIDDSTETAASALLFAMKREAEQRGLSCTLCRCQLHPADKAEHLLIPQANLAFYTANRYHPAPKSAERTIHMTRFLDRDKTADCRFRLGFNKKAVRELLNEAIKAQSAAGELKDMMNAYYEHALREDDLAEAAEQLCREVMKDC